MEEARKLLGNLGEGRCKGGVEVRGGGEGERGVRRTGGDVGG